MNPTQALFGRLSVTQLAERLAAGQAPRLIDVREAWEHELASLPGAELMPLSEMQSWWQALDRHEELVFYCHTGRRSAMVCEYLASAEGFDKLLNLEGGIAAWSREVDPSVPRY
jgi:rhodanese-related sulfurtransferase